MSQYRGGLSFYRSDEAKTKGVTLKAPKEGDAGFDLPSLDEVTIAPNEQVLLRTGIHVAIPIGWVGIVRDRSSVGIKGGLTTAGVIDAGYRGELKVIFRNLSNEAIHFNIGDKVAQLLVIEHLTGDGLKEELILEDLGHTERNQMGFGSTGR